MANENHFSAESGAVRWFPIGLIALGLLLVAGAIGLFEFTGSDRSNSAAEEPKEQKPPSAADLEATTAKAGQGDVVAQNMLGEFYLNGRGVRANSATAAEWFAKAAGRGYGPAQLNLGMLFEAGQGVTNDYARALEWYRKAAEQGLPAAQYSLATMYAAGRGTPRDFLESVRWLTKSAGQGHGLSQFSLGHCYIDGTGVPQDLTEAFKWLTLAASQNISDATTALDEIKSKMTRAQISEARSRVEKFVPGNEVSPTLR